MASIFVLYRSYEADEGCDAPSGIAYTEDEAQQWCNKNPDCNTYAEFDVDLERITK